MSTELAARRTPLHDWHRRAGARLVDFAGWSMPVHYTGVIEEHRAVREAAGVFDVSHMGELRVRGPRAAEAVQWLTPNNVASLSPGRSQYSSLLNEAGGFVDDLLVYCVAEDDFLLVVNASNIASDLAWVVGQTAARVGDSAEVIDESEATALLALQGPLAADILQRETDLDLDSLSAFQFSIGQVAGAVAMVSRTGYTGEDGFELYVPATSAVSVWERLLAAGEGVALRPVGLAARDTLRLEAGLMLYGNDIDATVTPFEAGLAWTVKLKSGDFVGRDALVSQSAAGVPRRMIGLELEGRRIGRHDAPVLSRDRRCGTVTSGTWSPTLERAIAMARVDAEVAEQDSFEIDIRGQAIAARRVPLPFYRRPDRA